MTKKKQSKHWKIALTHYVRVIVSAGVFVMFLPVVFILFFDFSTEQLLKPKFLVVFQGLYIVLLWFMTQYSARLVKRKYIIDNPRKIVNLSTIYAVIIGGATYILSLLWNGISLVSGGMLIIFFITTAIFYFTSKKFISQTENNPV